MTRLNQIIAVEQGVKSKAEKDLTAAYHAVQRTTSLNGLSKTYTPKDDEGDQYPSESTLVQTKISDVLEDVKAALSRLFDVTLTKEVGNANAKADVVVDGETILSQVPVTYLLFLEKKLVELNAFVSKLPTLDPAQSWSFDSNKDVWVTPAVQSFKTKKTPKNWVKAEATDKHPAQVEVFYEDIVVGTWTKTEMSGAVSATRKATLLDRVVKLQNAVKFAREEANSEEITDQVASEAVFSYLFS